MSFLRILSAIALWWIESIEILIDEIDALERPTPQDPNADMRFGKSFPMM